MQPDLIHGLPVIASIALPDAPGIRPRRRVVIVDRQSTGETMRYVVAFHNLGDAEWDHGAYTQDLARAWTTFCRRYEDRSGVERLEDWQPGDV